MLINKIKNVRLNNFGLGDKVGSYQMLVGEKNVANFGGASKVVDGLEVSSSGLFEPVNVVRLDKHIPADRSISLIHLDIEGFEQKALEGAMSIIKRDFPILILETLPEDSWLNTNLFSIGYEVQEIILGNTVLSHSNKV